jgi:hypothetical protein
MPGKEPSPNAPGANTPVTPPVDYANFYKTTGLMAGFNFFMSAGRFGRTANVLARTGFLYGLHQIGKAKQAEQTAASTTKVVPVALEKAVEKITSLFFKPEKPTAEITPEGILSTVSKTTETIFIGGGEVVNKMYKP